MATTDERLTILERRSKNQGKRLKRIEGHLGFIEPPGPDDDDPIDEPVEDEPVVPVPPEPPAGIVRGVNSSYYDEWCAEMYVANEAKQGRWWTTPDWTVSISRKMDGGPMYTPARLALYHGMGGHYHKGPRMLRWDGDGLVKLEGDAQSAPISTGRIDFDITNPTDAGFQIVVQSGGVGNIRVTRADQEHEPLAPHKGMVERMKADGVKLYRFMNAMQTNREAPYTWDTRPSMDQWAWASENRGVPVEAMVALCNAVGCDPWFNMPDRATDEYIREFAMYVKANLAPSLKAWVEPTNEGWMSFPQHQRLASGGDWGAYIVGYRNLAVRVFRIWREVFGDDGCERVVGSQHNNGNPTDASNWLSDQLLSAEVRAEKPTKLAIAPYFANSVWATAQQLSSFDAIIAWMESDIAYRVDLCKPHIATANSAGLELVCYESGPSLFPVLDAGANSRMIAIRNDERFGAVCAKHIRGLRALGIRTICEYSYLRRAFAGLLSSLDDSGKPRHESWLSN